MEEERISIDEQICHGAPCIKGTRITVSVILDCLADGMNEEQLLKEYPSLKPDDVSACLSFASGLIKTMCLRIEKKER